nr:MAG TPA: curlin transcriptional regulator [Caudoviricetes sp.]
MYSICYHYHFLKVPRDDCDYQFRGCEDDYFICDCGASCRVKIRYNRVCREEWQKP